MWTLRVPIDTPYFTARTHYCSHSLLCDDPQVKLSHTANTKTPFRSSICYKLPQNGKIEHNAGRRLPDIDRQTDSENNVFEEMVSRFQEMISVMQKHGSTEARP